MQREIAWLLEEKYQGNKTQAFIADCDRLHRGEPLAYIIGHLPFHNVTIRLDSRPLIPRIETEYWTDLIIRTIDAKPAVETIRILDLCAGSGCIGVAIGHALPHTHISFAELNHQHTKTIATNCQGNHLAADRYEIYTGDLFNPLPDHPAQFDYIVANPPYIDPALDRTTPAVRDFEPAEALYGGPAGLAIIKRILHDAPHHLFTHGQLWIEHEPEQTAHLLSLTPPELHLQHTHKDQYGLPRVSVWTMAL